MNLNTWDQPAKATDRACDRWWKVLAGWRAVSGAINDRRTERNNKHIRVTAQVVEQFYRQS